jgi:hypothetical protein
MRERDAALHQAIGEIAAILGDALVRCSSPLLSPGKLTSRRQRALMGLLS